jgi:hypothetical protein
MKKQFFIGRTQQHPEESVYVFVVVFLSVLTVASMFHFPLFNRVTFGCICAESNSSLSQSAVGLKL